MIVNQAVNKVLKEMPADPISVIAGELLRQQTNNVPLIQKLHAKRVFLLENPLYQTVKVSVYMSFQGRTELRYSHILAFDPEEQDKFLYDKP